MHVLQTKMVELIAVKTLARSRASDVLVSHHHTICKILSASETTLNSLTGKLYEMRIVDRPTKNAVISKGQYKGADILLDHVEMKVNDKPQFLCNVLLAMQELEVLKHVVQQMEKWKAKDMNTLQGNHNKNMST